MLEGTFDAFDQPDFSSPDVYAGTSYSPSSPDWGGTGSRLISWVLPAPAIVEYTLLPLDARTGSSTWTRLTDYRAVSFTPNLGNHDSWGAQFASFAETLMSSSSSSSSDAHLRPPGTHIELTLEDNLVSVKFSATRVGTYIVFVLFRNRLVVPQSQVLVQTISGPPCPARSLFRTSLTSDAMDFATYLRQSYFMTSQTIECILELRDVQGNTIDTQPTYPEEEMIRSSPSLLSLGSPFPMASVRITPVPSQNLVHVWDNAGIATKSAFSIWRVATPEGYVRFGDTISAGTDEPEHTVLTVRASPVFRHPRGFELVWRSEKGINQLWLWRPIPPDSSFMALGLVATTTALQPPRDLVVTAHVDAVSRVVLPDYPVWSDFSQSDSSTCSMYLVEQTGLLTLARLSREARAWASSSLPPTAHVLNANATVSYVCPHGAASGRGDGFGTGNPFPVERIKAWVVLPSGREERVEISAVYPDHGVFSLAYTFPATVVGVLELYVTLDGIPIQSAPFPIYVHDVSPSNTTAKILDPETGALIPKQLVQRDLFLGCAESESLALPLIEANRIYILAIQLRGKSGAPPLLQAWPESGFEPVHVGIGPRTVIHAQTVVSSSVIHVAFSCRGNAPLEFDVPVAYISLQAYPGQLPQYWSRAEVLSFGVVDPVSRTHHTQIRAAVASKEARLLKRLWDAASRLVPRSPALAVTATLGTSSSTGLKLDPSPLVRSRLANKGSLSSGVSMMRLEGPDLNPSLVELLRSRGIERPCPLPFFVGEDEEELDDLEESTKDVVVSGTADLVEGAPPVVLHQAQNTFSTTVAVLPPALAVLNPFSQVGGNEEDEIGTVLSNVPSVYRHPDHLEESAPPPPLTALPTPTSGTVPLLRPRTTSGEPQQDSGLFSSLSGSSIGSRPVSRNSPRKFPSLRPKYIFVLDVSKSMQGLQTIRIPERLDKVQVRRAETARLDLVHALEHLPRNAYFEIIKFGDKAVPLFHGFQRARASRITRARKFVLAANTSDELNSMAPNSNIYMGLEAAFIHPQYESSTHVVLYTDGEPELRAGGSSTPACTYPADTESLKAEIIAPHTKQLFFNNRPLIVQVRLYSPVLASVAWMESFVEDTSDDSEVLVIGPVVTSALHPPRDYANV